MQKTILKGKKGLSLFLAVLMVFTCFPLAARMADGDAAEHTYKVRVYGRIFDDCDPGLLTLYGYYNGVEYTEQLVTDPTSNEYGKPAGYAWSGSDKTNKMNTAGITLFYDGGSKYIAEDMTDEIENAGLVTEPVFTDLKNQPEMWPYEYPENEPGGSFCLEYDLDSMPTEVFWLVDYNEKADGTSFGIYRITLENAEGKEVSLWEGLTGARSNDQCYYGSITPGGLKICWDDATDSPSDNEHYALYTKTKPGTWRDYTDPNAFNGYPTNAYVNGGVSVVFSEIENNYSNTLKYLEVGNSSDNYYVNVVNHSTQDAVVSLSGSEYITNYTDNVVIPVGESKAWLINNEKLTKEEVIEFTATYTLKDVVDADGTAVVFTQPAFISVSKVAETAATPMFTLENIVDEDILRVKQQFQADYGIFEEVSLNGSGTDHVDFNYNYFLDLDGIDSWLRPLYFRMYAESDSDHRVILQYKDYKGTFGTMAITDTDPNATLKIANLIEKLNDDTAYTNTNDISYPTDAEVTAGGKVTPKFDSYSGFFATENGCMWDRGDKAWFRFEGKPFKPTENAAEGVPSGVISFDKIFYVDNENKTVTFSGDINVFSYDKSPLREYLKDIAGQGTDWAPMSARYDQTVFDAYTSALEKAMRILGNQKITQAEIIAAKNELDAAAQALLKEENLVNQVADVTYTLHGGDITAEATETIHEYTLIDINSAIVLNGKENFATATIPEGEIRKESNVSVNYTEGDTALDVINYHYWSVDVTGVNPAIEKAETALADETLGEEYKAAIADAKIALEGIDQTEGTDTPATQAEIDNAIAYVDTLIEHEQAASKLEDLIENGNLTDDEKAKAQEVLDANKLPEDPTVENKTAIDDSTKAITDEIARLEEGIGDGTVVKPDYKAAEDKIAEAEKLAEETTDLQDDVKAQIDALKTDLQAIKDKEPEATKAADQEDVDEIAEKAQAIIDGINNGSLRKPDYKPYDDAKAAYDALIENETFGDMNEEDAKAVADAIATVEEWKDDSTLTAEKNEEIKEQAEIISEIVDKYDACVTTGHSWSETVDYVKAETPLVNNVGTYTQTCTVCGKTQETIASRADYSALNTAKEALDAIDTSKLTDSAKAAVEAAKAKYDEFDKNLPATVTTATGETFKGGEDAIKALTEEISKLVTDTNVGIADGTLAKPDYSKIDPVIEVYNTITKEHIPEGEDKTTAEKIISDITEWKADPEATASEYQEKIDGYVDALTAINNKYAGCTQGNHKWVLENYTAVTDPTAEKVGTYNYKCENNDATKSIDVPRESYSTLDDEKAVLEGILNADLTSEARTEIETVLAQAEGTATGDAAAENLDQNLPAAVTGLMGEVLDQASKTTIENFEDKLQAVIDKYADEDGNPKANATKDYTVKFYEEDGVTLIDTVVVKKGETAKSEKAPMAKPYDENNHYTANALVFENVQKDENVIATYKADSHVYGEDYIEKRPELVNGEWVNGILAAKCNGCDHIKRTEVSRADYSELDEAVKALEDIKANNKLTAEAEKKIEDAIAKAENLDDNLIKTENEDHPLNEQGLINDLVAELGDIKTEIENEIKEGTAIKPDYSEAEKNLEDAKKLVEETANLKDGVKEEISRLEEELQTIKDKKDPEATKAADQDEVDRIAEELKAIIDGINDGTLVNPDYTKAEKAIEDADSNKNIPAEEKEKVDELAKQLEDIKKNPDTDKNDQQAIDDIEKAVNEIVTKYSECKDGHAWSDPVLDPKPTAEKVGLYTQTCGRCGATKTTDAPLAEYDELNAAVEVLEAVDQSGLTEKAKAEIADLIDKAEKLDKNLAADVIIDGETVEGGQKEIDALTEEINNLIEGINGTEGDAYKKADTADLEKAIAEYDAAKTESADKGEEILDSVIAKENAIKELFDNIESDPNATEADNKQAIADAAAALREYIDTADDPDDIKDEYLKPDYDVVDDNLADAKELAKTPDVKEEVADQIEKLEKEIQTIKDKEPEATKTTDQGEVDKIAEELKAIIDGINDKSLLDPNYKPAEDAIKEAKDLADKTANVKDEVDSLIAELETALQNIKDKTEPEANARDDQKAIDDIEKAVKDIIDGIKDGSLLDPNYKPAEDAIKEAESNKYIPEDQKKEIERLKEELQSIKDKTEPEANARDDQKAIDDIKNAVQTIVDKYSKCFDGHYFNEPIIDKDSTCTEVGQRTLICRDCGLVRVETISMKAHAYAWTVTENPTCTATGTRAYKCADCGKINKTESIPATGHSFGTWVETKAPTCTDKGTETRSCGTCGTTESRDVAAKGHSFGAWAETKAPTCTDKGTETRSCGTCGTTESRDVAAKGHSFGTWTEEKAPTCTDKGIEVSVCGTCGTVERRDIAAKGHTFGAWTVDIPAGCTDPGLKTSTCSVCNKTVSEVIPATGHTYGEWTIDVAPTCTEKGTEKRVCHCGGYQEREVSATGHDDADGNGLCDFCGVTYYRPDGCICHKNNVFSKIVRLFYSIISFILRKKITCCPDMEWYFDGIDSIT